MVTGGLLHLHHHHLLLLHPRLPFHLADSSYLLCRRSVLNRFFPPKRNATTPSQCGTSIRCVRQEDQAGNGGEVVEWVNKTARDPMVELDPVTVFRQIAAERCAIAAKARAKEEANLASQTTLPPSFLGSTWRGKPAIVIAALVLLALAATLYFLRLRRDRHEALELTSKDSKGTIDSSINGRRKLVQDTIKAPESVLTAMALGAASVSRPKGHVSSTHDTLHASNGNAVESHKPQGAMDFHPIVNIVAVEGLESDLYGKPTFGPTLNNSSIVEELTPLKVDNVGIDITEGPWFGQGVDDSEMLAPVEELESENPPLAEFEKPKSEEPKEFDGEDVSIESQTLPFSYETTSLPAVGQLVYETSVDEVPCKPPVFAAGVVVDGEFHGELVALSDQTNQSNDQVLQFKFEEHQNDDILAVSSTTYDKLEQIIKEDSITSKDAANDTACREHNMMGQSKDNEVFIMENGKESLTDCSGSFVPSNCQNLDVVADCSPADTTVQASDEDSREESKKALQAAVPAIAVGVGTVGALFGVAGGLQVVGFVAMASLISRDFLWAESRESLWQELNGITDRQKLLDFLAKRSIMRMEQN